MSFLQIYVILAESVIGGCRAVDSRRNEADQNCVLIQCPGYKKRSEVLKSHSSNSATVKAGNTFQYGVACLSQIHGLKLCAPLHGP